LAVLTHEPRFDAMGSIAIGLLLVVIAFVLATEMRSLLIGEAASADEEHAIRTALLSGALKRVIHMRTTHLGPDELLVAAKIELDSTLSFAEVAREIDAAEARVRAAVPTARLMYLEPDVYRASEPPS
ncbi:MAG TPA: hypothetical protein VHM19_11265, partial [Polyangiales bacterium]|nr:hypothetical protein [Polyangiales bacterium]